MNAQTPVEGNVRAKLLTKAASFLGRSAIRLSRLTGKGDGTMIGGKVALRVDPHVLERLSGDRKTVLVTGTNGKSTTREFLAAALSTTFSVEAGSTANRIPGIVSALISGSKDGVFVLETRESDAGYIAQSLRPEVMVLLNLSHDTDKDFNARDIEKRMRKHVNLLEETVVIANCDDIRIASIAFDSPSVVWVAAGVGKQNELRECPRCYGLIADADTGSVKDELHPDWFCTNCGFLRPQPTWEISYQGGQATLSGPCNFESEINLALPGRVNQSNASQAVAAAVAMGVNPSHALAEISNVSDIGQRYSYIPFGNAQVRLLLAKNPVAVQAALSMIDLNTDGVVLLLDEVNDNSYENYWIWDVDYSALCGKEVVVCGEAAESLSTRLTYSGVGHITSRDALSAIAMCGDGAIDVLIPGVEKLQSLERRMKQTLGSYAPIVGQYEACDEIITPPVSKDRKVRIGLVLPEMQWLSGDRGNALVMQKRLLLRGYDAEILEFGIGTPIVADLDIYFLGGVEGSQQKLAVEHLKNDGGLQSAVATGRTVFAVRAGAHILGHSFEDNDGVRVEGLGLIDFSTRLRPEGELDRFTSKKVYQIRNSEYKLSISGFNNSSQLFQIGSQAEPFASNSEGACQGSIIATNLQGPVLAMNPRLADCIIAQLLGVSVDTLEPIHDANNKEDY